MTLLSSFCASFVSKTEGNAAAGLALPNNIVLQHFQILTLSLTCSSAW